MKAKLNNADVHRRYQQVTTCTGYSIKDDFIGVAINPLQMSLCIALAVILLGVTFIVQPLNFWLCIAITTLVLAVLAIILGGNTIEKRHFDLESLFWGLSMAVVLYIIFWLGARLISLSILDFTHLSSYAAAIYSLQEGVPPLLIGLVLILITSPCEEIFWRGFIQRGLSQSFGETKGWLWAALLYAGAHIVSLNPLLVLSALIGGLIWGKMYQKQHHIVSCIISHALWALVVFLLLPII